MKWIMRGIKLMRLVSKVTDEMLADRLVTVREVVDAFAYMLSIFDINVKISLPDNIGNTTVLELKK